MNPGVTIFLRAGDDLAASLACLESLAVHNSYKPLEVLLWAKASREAVALVRPLLPRLFVRVLPGSTSDFARLVQQIRYDRLFILDSAARFQADVLSDWLERQRTDAPATLLCRKEQLALLCGRPLNLALDQIAGVLRQSSQPAPPVATPSAKVPAKQNSQAQDQLTRNFVNSCQKVNDNLGIPDYECTEFWTKFLDYKKNLLLEDEKQYRYR